MLTDLRRPIKTIFLQDVDELRGFVRSLVIPLPGDRALRIGMRWEGWCKLGPRRYQVVASPGFIADYAHIAGTTELEAAERLEELGVDLQRPRPVE